MTEDIRKKVTDKSGRNVVAALFKEFHRCDVKFDWVYTVKEVKQMFLDARDPSEYKVAMQVVGDWDHWQQIRNHPYLKDSIDKWQEELAIKMRSEAIEQMRMHAKAQGGTAAAKWLADKGYADAELPKVGRGRPKKDDVEPDHSRVEEKLRGVAHLVSIAGGKG